MNRAAQITPDEGDPVNGDVARHFRADAPRIILTSTQKFPKLTYGKKETQEANMAHDKTLTANQTAPLGRAIRTFVVAAAVGGGLFSEGCGCDKGKPYVDGNGDLQMQ